jgi:addiction module HigA family antidote
MTNAQFAEHAGIKTVVVNGLCIGRRLSPHMALRLGEYTSFPAEYWMALQTAQDLAQARDEVRNLKEYRSTQYGT